MRVGLIWVTGGIGMDSAIDISTESCSWSMLLFNGSWLCFILLPTLETLLLNHSTELIQWTVGHIYYFCYKPEPYCLDKMSELPAQLRSGDQCSLLPSMSCHCHSGCVPVACMPVCCPVCVLPLPQSVCTCSQNTSDCLLLLHFLRPWPILCSVRVSHCLTSNLQNKWVTTRSSSSDQDLCRGLEAEIYPGHFHMHSREPSH